MVGCPACARKFDRADFRAVADHLTEQAGQSDAAHVRWLNQYIGRRKIGPEELATGLADVFDLRGHSLPDWIEERFIAKFFGPTPHPFVLALQHPSRAVLIGYVVEHQHFLRQWVRSCAYIMARTDEPEVVHYELDNLATEYGGFGPERPAHYELLLRMGESLGLDRSRALATPPLPATLRAIGAWNRMAAEDHWLEAMVAMHSLELIAHRNLRARGATVPYFDPAILEGDSIPAAAKAFLREGYEADIGHSEEALALVDRFSRAEDRVVDVQSAFLRSIDLFDDYLLARLERAREYEN